MVALSTKIVTTLEVMLYWLLSRYSIHRGDRPDCGPRIGQLVDTDAQDQGNVHCTEADTRSLLPNKTLSERRICIMFIELNAQI